MKFKKELLAPNGFGLGKTAVLTSLKYEFSEKDSKLILFKPGKCSRCAKLVLVAGEYSCIE